MLNGALGCQTGVVKYLDFNFEKIFLVKRKLGGKTGIVPLLKKEGKKKPDFWPGFLEGKSWPYFGLENLPCFGTRKYTNQFKGGDYLSN